MKAVVSERYGGPEVLSLREIARPDPKPGQILVRVHVSTVSRTDCGNLRGHPRFARIATGMLRPRRTVLGMDFAGLVEAVGEGVSAFTPGERVFGLSPKHYGAHAEFLCLDAHAPIARVPERVSLAEAVVCEGLWYAKTYLDAFALGAEHSLLVYGASGAIGTAAVQLARARGAAVTAVVDTPRIELARALGAARVIDYTAEDYTQIGERFDFVLDAVGKADFRRARGLLTPGGVFSATDFGPNNQNVPHILLDAIGCSRHFTFPMPNKPEQAVNAAADLLASGELRAIIDRSYPLEEIAEAYRYVESEQKTGIVTLEVAGEG